MFLATQIPFDTNSDRFQQRVAMLYRLGYQGAIVELKNLNQLKIFKEQCFPNQQSPKIAPPVNITSILRYKNPEYSIPLIPRITLQPKNENDLKRQLQEMSQTKIIVVVQSTDKEILEVAARDGRVDILAVPTIEYQKALTKGIISLTQQNACSLEISLTPLLEAEHHARTKIMRMLYRLFLMAKPLSHLFICGSYTTDINLLRGPRECEAILEALFEIPEIFAKKIFRENAEALALRFIKRDQDLFIEPGVEVVQERSLNEDEIREQNKELSSNQSKSKRL